MQTEPEKKVIYLTIHSYKNTIKYYKNIHVYTAHTDNSILIEVGNTVKNTA